MTEHATAFETSTNASENFSVGCWQRTQHKSKGDADTDERWSVFN